MPLTSPSRLPRDAQRLLMLTAALARSGSRLEDIHWESLLGAHLDKLLLGKKNKTVETALEHLLDADLDAYEVLVEQAETHSESCTLEHDGQQYDALLVTAPIVAWTRYRLPEAELSGEQVAILSQALLEHIAAPEAQIALLPALVNFEQMPQTFHETRTWTQRLAQQALAGTAPAVLAVKKSDNEGVLADARFAVGAIVVPRGAPLFRWQVETSEQSYPTREECHARWMQACEPVLSPIFTGCQLDYLPPDAYYVNGREADRRVRPVALKAAATWLQTALQISGADLRANIAACGDSVIQEFRVGFSKRGSNDVIYGCVWPVLSKEEAQADGMEDGSVDQPDEIAALLKESGVGDVRRLPGLHPADFCDDCGAPFFPNPLGEMLHPELPEETDLTPVHFH